MKKLIILFVLILASCGSKNKKYKYIETREEKNLVGGIDLKEAEPEIIEALTDSAAYMQAFEKFCIAEKVNKDMTQSLGSVYSTPIKFQIFNDQNIDITYLTVFKDKEKLETEAKERIFALENSLQESVDKVESEKLQSFKSSAKIDSIKIKSLKPFFRTKTDEFSNENIVWFEPKSAAKFTNRNTLHCYFQTENGMPKNLRFRMQYYAEDWLFIDKIQFSIDGKAFDYIPNRMETDSGDGGHIWEWYDESLTDSDKELIYALANAKSAKMKLLGRQYFDIRKITKDQIINIKRTLDLYNAMGGNF